MRFGAVQCAPPRRGLAWRGVAAREHRVAHLPAHAYVHPMTYSCPWLRPWLRRTPLLILRSLAVTSRPATQCIIWSEFLVSRLDDDQQCAVPVCVCTGLFCEIRNGLASVVQHSAAASPSLPDAPTAARRTNRALHGELARPNQIPPQFHGRDGMDGTARHGPARRHREAPCVASAINKSRRHHCGGGGVAPGSPAPSSAS